MACCPCIDVMLAAIAPAAGAVGKMRSEYFDLFSLVCERNSIRHNRVLSRPPHPNH